jgi:hypothetical protein
VAVDEPREELWVRVALPSDNTTVTTANVVVAAALSTAPAPVRVAGVSTEHPSPQPGPTPVDALIAELPLPPRRQPSGGDATPLRQAPAPQRANAETSPIDEDEGSIGDDSPFRWQRLGRYAPV